MVGMGVSAEEDRLIGLHPAVAASLSCRARSVAVAAEEWMAGSNRLRWSLFRSMNRHSALPMICSSSWDSLNIVFSSLAATTHLRGWSPSGDHEGDNESNPRAR